ncbi:hypothetical protein RJ640_029582, partial [Escallonia rubra]
MAALPPMPTLSVIPSLPKATLPPLPAMPTLPKAALQPSPAITLPTSPMTLPTAPTTLPKPTLRPYQTLKFLFAKPNIASHAHCPEGNTASFASHFIAHHPNLNSFNPNHYSNLAQYSFLLFTSFHHQPIHAADGDFALTANCPREVG